MKRSTSSNPYLNVQLFCGACVSIIALTGFLGWLVGTTHLKNIGTDFVSMNPLVAINFLLFGFWLIFKGKIGFSQINYLTWLLLLINAFLIIPKVVDLFYSRRFTLENVLFPPSFGVNTISPATLLNFLILNLALIASLSKSKNKEYIFQLFVIGSFAVSSISLCADLFNYNAFIGASVLTSIALNNCISFVFLCLGCLFLYPYKGYMRSIMSKKLGGSIARKILPLLIVIPLFAGSLRIFGQHLNLYTTELGTAIYVVVMAFLLFILSSYFAKKLNVIDSIRKYHEKELVKKSSLLQKSEFLLQETESIAKVGGWEISLSDHKVFYTKEVFLIREMDEAAEIGFEQAHPPFPPELEKVIMENFELALKEGKSYDVEANLVTDKGREIWVRVKGNPVLDNEGKVIAIRGTLQDIDESKKKEILLQESIKIIKEQNALLMNFTHIVSHNLRTHAGNIKTTLSIYDAEEDTEEKALILKMTKQAADSLNNTIADLNEIVAIQAAANQLKSTLYFEDVFSNVRLVLEREIKASQAIIYTDFSQLEKMDYVPAYLESIFHNFLSNAIKYRRPDVQPEIKITTCIENEGEAMIFSDNGLGIDLAKHKEKLFGMYKTFHNHPDSTGIGLFLTKNQVESLGGNIVVDSEVNIGTTFKIVF